MSTFYNSKNKVYAEISALTPTIIADLKSKELLPRGSALLTGAGKLAPDINSIFHAATGTMMPYFPSQTYYEPSLLSVENAISACFALAKANGNNRLAIPYIGGKIFKGRIFDGQGVSEEDQNHKLVASIVGASITNAKLTGLDFCFVVFDTATNLLFSHEIKKSYDELNFSKKLMVGDIVDFSLHQCDGIVNAANMEVQFGGGISGAIAKASQDQDNIDKDARSGIIQFWADYEARL
ncbi:macro domain-containing protein [Cyclobacterium plantarum]|uniref:Macro domain-containing protein n=1 Tax=Cyclobacterium plantarum TaxID=2716263 RepID=A0ABX0HAM7_9BACT|nr:hypothetical protein [Cyclobacterium plantarum]NHE58707.1 hypothetical protein [Cyclobacterium plantarum]